MKRHLRPACRFRRIRFLTILLLWCFVWMASHLVSWIAPWFLIILVFIAGMVAVILAMNTDAPGDRAKAEGSESLKSITSVLMVIFLQGLIYVQCRNRCTAISVLCGNISSGQGVILSQLMNITCCRQLCLTMIVAKSAGMILPGSAAGIQGMLACYQWQKRGIPSSVLYFVFPLFAVELESFMTLYQMPLPAVMMLFSLSGGLLLIIVPLMLQKVSLCNR